MMAEPTHSILLASEQDRGKSLQAIEFALRMGFKTVLFVGIKDTFEQFNERAKAQSNGTREIRRIDTTKKGSQAQADMEWGKPGWYFIGHQLLVSRDWGTNSGERMRLGTWQDIAFDLVIVDEVHLLGGYGNRGQKTLHSLKPDWRLAMSGTFYGNRFENSWAPTRWLWPDLIDQSFYRWSSRWVQSEPVLRRNGSPMLTPKGEALKKAGKPVPEWEVVTKALGEVPPEGRFVSTLPCYIRHVGEDMVPDPEVIEVELLPDQRKMYDELESQALTWIRSRPFVVEMSVTLRERLRTATLGSFDFEDVWDRKRDEWKQEVFFPADSHSTKLDALLHKLAEFPDDRVVLGTHSKRFAKLTVARMQAAGLKAVEWSGDVSSKERQAIKETWLETDDIQYIVTVFRSFATGIDWVQQRCWRMGILSEQVGDGTTMGQWVRRVFRTGEHKHKFSWFTIHATDTYDSGEFHNRELQQAVQALTLAAPVGGVANDKKEAV